MSKVTVRIGNPIKVGTAILMPGAHEVEPEVAEELWVAGHLVPEVEAVAETVAPVSTVSAEDIDRMVAERAKIIAETMVEAVVEQAMSEVIGERDAATARAEAAEAKLAELEAASKDSAPDGEKQPAAPAAEAPKKGSKATKG